MNTPVQITTYGKNIIGNPYRDPEGGTWFRIDTYVGSDGHETQERRFAGPGDKSPMFIAAYGDNPGNGRYHPKCSCCWLGFSHTLDNHNRNAVGSWD